MNNHTDKIIILRKHWERIKGLAYEATNNPEKTMGNTWRINQIVEGIEPETVNTKGKENEDTLCIGANTPRV